MLTAMRLPVIDAMLQVRVRFVTKVATLKVTEVPIAVPETLGRYGLSEVINHLLGSLPGDADSSEEAAEPAKGRAPIPFDILIDGRFLRTSLVRYMQRNAVSGEHVVELEYLPALRQPTEEGSDSQPDWIGAIASSSGSSTASDSAFLATGCYDGCLRLYSDALTVVHSAQVSQQPLTAVAISADSNSSSADSWLLAGGKDRLLTLFKVGNGASTLDRTAVLRGHENSIACVALPLTTSSSSSSSSDSSSSLAASGDWDGRVCLWSLAAAQSQAPQQQQSHTVKKRKGAEGAAATALLEVLPAAAFKAHAQAVAGCGWGRGGSLYTGSWDHSIKTWDAERQVYMCTHTSIHM
jgi:ribosome biogenesis protein